MIEIINSDCMQVMDKMSKNSVNFTLTDIPYEFVNRKDNGLRSLNKGNADIKTFCLIDFLDLVHKVTTDNIVVFCGKEQLSTIHEYFHNKKQGTVRQGVWIKSNPMPSNGKYVYLSGIENFVWFRKPKGTFNAYCKNPVFVYPNGSSKLHPTEKNHNLLEEIILDNSNEGDLIFDPCMGSGSTGLVANKNNRKFFGVEIDKKYFEIAQSRFDKPTIKL